MVYWDVTMYTLSLIFGLMGIKLKRGSNEFLSY